MLSRTSEYALRAMIYLASHQQDWPICGKDIAQATDVPRKYLSKILADLVRADILQSTRGKSGGFNLLRGAKQTFLFDILAPFESFENRRCLYATRDCNQANPCEAHAEWKRVLDAEQRFLRKTTLHQVTFASSPGAQKRAGQAKPGSKKRKAR